jgi:mannose-6-phosphate isomerase-like protein (cupin superfamily)
VGKLIQFRWDEQASATGPIFGGEVEDLDFTLLQWHEGQGVQEHVNDEVDVIMVVLSGTGFIVADGERMDAQAGTTFVLPKGTRRSISSTSSDFRYLNVHKRRKRLMPGNLSRKVTKQQDHPP